ncbi:hypothetical protein IF1G_04313 [Cordyceps javanica]|uniref:Uncharacterized protein n=1 Tax=Cordyceps javanica TaxID=43265 RepID=A0A545V5T5_9HYPO|nr:hypothetical protein IF1G_04313 [Cordyceps javanica]
MNAELSSTSSPNVACKSSLTYKSLTNSRQVSSVSRSAIAVHLASSAVSNAITYSVVPYCEATTSAAFSLFTLKTEVVGMLGGYCASLIGITYSTTRVTAQAEIKYVTGNKAVYCLAF